MKRFVLFLFAIFVCCFSYAQTETINWYVDGELYDTTTCESGNDVILPATPTKTGYTFQGWDDGYIPIEYLESTGTQWIDTEIEYTSYSKYKFITRVNYSNTTTRQLNGAQGYVYVGVVNGHYQIAQGGNNYRNIVAVPNVFTNCEIEFDCPNNTVSFNIGNSTGTASNIGYQKTLGAKIYLFNLNNEMYPGIGEKISYFKIYQNNTLVRDFIPVLNGNGTPCMYDKVEGKFYYNVGTGDFIAGPAI